MLEFVRSNRFTVRAVCGGALVGVWLCGGIFAASMAQTASNRAQTKKPTAPVSQKAAVKQTPKTTAKQTPKPAPKSSPKAAAKTASSAKPTTKQTSADQRFIVAAFSVNLREQPSAGAAGGGELNVGTVVRAAQRSASKQTFGGKTDYWYKIAAPNDKTGWIFGGFLRPFDSNKRETIYRQIAAERLKAAGKSFPANVELYEFLTRALSEVKTQSIAAEIALNRLLALKAALAAIPIERVEQLPYKTFTAAQAENIVYSEPAGAYFVRSEQFWNLAKKHKTLPIADRIAWEGVHNPLPGECEGYLNCYLYVLRTTHGEYLQQFPKGKNAVEALREIGDMLKPIVADAAQKEIYVPPSDVSDRAEFYQSIADLRVIISKTGFFEKDAVIKQLNQIAEGYR